MYLGMSSIGFIDWFLDLLGLRGVAVQTGTDADNTVMEVNPADGTVEQYVVTPCGYRIRVPQPQDVSHSVGELLPSVRESLAQIPPLPKVVTELMREVQSANSTASSVAGVAASDPVLAAALLRTVNSSAMGLSRKITSVTEAVSYLGFGLVKSVLVRLRLDETLPTTGAAATDAEDLWVHCLAVSYVADVLAERVNGVDRGFVSTLGLLHDIGKLAMLSQGTLQHQMALTPSSNEDHRSREARLLGADHAGLGASLAHMWGLPSDLVQAIRFHHHPEKAFEHSDPLPLRQAAYVVFIANQLTKLGFAHTDQIEIAPVPPETSELLGIKTGLEEMLDRKVKNAITKAILFASENTKQSKTAVKRLIRLRSGEDAAAVVANAPAAAPSRITVDDEGLASLFEKESDAATLFRAVGTTPEADIAKLLDAGMFHQSKLNLPSHLAGIATELLRCLLPNLITKNGELPVDLIQQYSDRTFTLAVRCDALKFSRRLSPTADATQGAKLLAAEFAGVTNLGWVHDITITTDGAAMALRMK